MLDALDLVLDRQFFTLEFVKLKFIRCGVVFFGHYGLFDRLVTTHEFRQVRFDRHSPTPFWVPGRQKCDTSAQARKARFLAAV
jgi:hypothetical protein